MKNDSFSPKTGVDASAAIEVKDLKKTYRSGLIFGKSFQALKGISFRVQRGEVFGLLGANGAGKTTFLKIMLGIIRKSDGEATLLGHPAGTRAGRQRVGYLPEHLRVPQHLTGYQALDFFGNLSNVPTNVIREKRKDLLETVGLEKRARDCVKQYSKGMLQRLGLAQALIHDPDLLVLDEPTDGLDPRARAEVREIILNLKSRGVTIFLNSHLLQEVEMICDRVAILDKGELRFCGDVDKVDQTFPKASAQSVRVEFELIADKDSIVTCLEGTPANVKEHLQGSTFCFGEFPDQASVDALIDRIRNHSISLKSLKPVRVSLEDAFLQLVDESSFKN